MADFSLDVKDEGDVVIIETTGYLNNVGGEKISEACYEKMENGKNIFWDHRWCFLIQYTQ